MPDLKISAATDITSVTGTDKVPIARAASTTSYYATITEIGTYAATVAPVQSVAGRTGTIALAHTDLTDWAATLAAYAPLAGPTFTGTPAAPTAAVDTNTTQIATTAMVLAQAAAATPLVNADTAAVGTATRFARADHVHPRDPAAADSVGRNLLHNGLDRVQQRGAGPWTTTGSYLSDRWLLTFTGGTASVTVGTLADADRTAIGDEEAQFALACVVAGGSSAGDFTRFAQRLENVRRTAGRQVTVRFAAKAAAGTPQIGLNYAQCFGTGGSPSANVTGTAQAATISTTLTGYSATFTIPAVTGKTFGSTAGTDYLELQFWLSSGSTNNTLAGSIGVQSATTTVYGRQLEVGSVATPLEKPDPRYELANCQRFYTTGIVGIIAAAANPTNAIGVTTAFPVRMRAVPSVTPGTLTVSINVTGAGTADNASADAFRFYVVSTAAGGVQGSAPFTATADL
jgi:hypothetical protein